MKSGKSESKAYFTFKQRIITKLVGRYRFERYYLTLPRSWSSKHSFPFRQTFLLLVT
jgi:hypothetical protein